MTELQTHTPTSTSMTLIMLYPELLRSMVYVKFIIIYLVLPNPIQQNYADITSNKLNSSTKMKR